MSSLLLLLILLCLSVHTCNARLLSIFVKESTVVKQGQLLIEDVGKAKTHKTPGQLVLEQIQNATGKNERKIYMNEVGENTMKHEEYSKDFLKEAAASKSATSGDIILPSPNDLQRLAKTQEFRSMSSKARALLGSSSNDNDEPVDSKENDVVEDTEMMDYAQPHRKPPIHNEKP